MKCPFCEFADTRVVETRETTEEITRRRRECMKCNKRFTTYERVEIHPLIVIKKNSVRESFDRDKLKRGVARSCEKRPVSIDQIEKLLDVVESGLRKADNAEVPSKMIGDLVMKQLKKLDKIAYIRFASVYLAFADVELFEKEAKKLK